MAATSLVIDRRRLLTGAVPAAALLAARPARAAAASLTFEELYGTIGVLGLAFSDKVKALAGQEVAMRGFMAPPLKAEAAFFVLTAIPMALCPFCSSDADWPNDIVVVYLDRKQTFAPPATLIEVTGRLEVGSWTDPESGFVSLIRLTHGRFAVVGRL
ncbi:conserved hypothetical protein [Methylobacterium sp. 4-46]|uniref:hypothetical protein n=1 Tax=unclassified Methylobacterium TaxID=2615210 RepID=UPI000152D72A|nr:MULTISPECIES: hypothetical protein [Methylobacterium]ACA20715.1 conserved hypothetical protein [Methylobacterium sp. 4-46]WFT79872.1 hypothetical protein QA634_32595 [Methylobacterium nodulans]